MACRTMALLDTLMFFSSESLERMALYSPVSPLHTDRMTRFLSVLPEYFSVLKLIRIYVSCTFFCHVIDHPFRFSGFIYAVNFALFPHKTLVGPFISIFAFSEQQKRYTLETLNMSDVRYLDIFQCHIQTV